MTAATDPQPGRVVLITREGAPDQYMQIVEPSCSCCCEPPPQPGWAYLPGLMVDERGFDATTWPLTLYLRHLEGDHWEMVPYTPLPEPGPELGERNRKILEKRLGRPIGGEAR